MPRQTQERLEGYAVQVVHHDQPATKDGQPVHDRHGNPQTVEMWTIVLTDPVSAHTVAIPLDKGGRDAVLQGLTSGLVIANGIPSV